MRSNDAMLGFLYDVFLFTMLQEMMALETGSDLGWYQHTTGSFHLYEHDQELARRIVRTGPTLCVEPMHAMSSLKDIPKAIEYERILRGSPPIDSTFAFDLDPYWADLLLVLLFHRLGRLHDRGGARAVADRLGNSRFSPLLRTVR
jgi:thymidylate synthase